MNTRINQLINYALSHHMIHDEDIIYSTNLLLDLLKLTSFEREDVEDASIYEILDDLLDYAVHSNLIENNITEKDLFDTKIMNCFMPRPSEVINKFNQLYKISPEQATDYFYQLSIDSNYIRKSRTDKNIKFHHYYKYGDIQISINLSKPEKDPKEIVKAKLIPSSNYPKCQLCKENVGFAGDMKRPARETHRIIPVTLNNTQYYLQYSPYVYYNEHCIVFNHDHVPMLICRKTFENLFAFIDQFPHYMVGSNADLPIVGGSILSHDHYQGGRHHFPMEDAEIIATYKLDQYPDVTIDMLKWPLSTLRLTSNHKQQIIDLAEYILNTWIDYDDEECDIISHTEGIRHNTVTPIARMFENKYQLDIVLRNNRTDEKYPLGIFHPHQEHHHIKKENIGLIEVMGLAILPARLKTEINELKECLLDKAKIEDYPELEKHQEWYKYLKTLSFTPETIDTMLEKEIVKKFTFVLENAGVYKMNEQGINGFNRFIKKLEAK